KYLNEVKQGVVSNSILLPNEVGSTQIAKETVKRILNNNAFDTPKPVELVKRFIRLTCGEDDLILDSFAGSGTTAQAVLELNREDGGDRKFVLVELEEKIAREITQERVRRVIRREKMDAGFEYATLGEPLFDANGAVNEKVSFDEMAGYVYFTETRTNWEKGRGKGNYLGMHGETHYFLLFDGVGGNVLNRRLVPQLRGFKGKKVVYADKCLLDRDALDAHGIVFKQIPYEVRVY
ncbi:MAG: site-specific DNA-methyltransferase, partial [Patescibacteria group bacterium]|nr:site-specific DNA-methyltransferase [Patescibacteria group bacterium]